MPPFFITNVATEGDDETPSTLVDELMKLYHKEVDYVETRRGESHARGIGTG